MIYEFEDTSTGEVVLKEFSMRTVPHIGDEIEDGPRKLRRLASSVQHRYANGENPRNDDDRRVARDLFEKPPYPGAKSDAQLVKEGSAKTMACSRWV